MTFSEDDDNNVVTINILHIKVYTSKWVNTRLLMSRAKMINKNMDNIANLARFLFVKHMNEYKVFDNKKSSVDPCVVHNGASVFFSNRELNLTSHY